MSCAYTSLDDCSTQTGCTLVSIQEGAGQRPRGQWLSWDVDPPLRLGCWYELSGLKTCRLQGHDA